MVSDVVRVAFRLALAHHPLCSWFRDDRIGPVCSGCALFWPAFFAATPAVLVALVRGTDTLAMLGAAIVLGLPQLLTARWRFGRTARGAIKLLGGVAVAIAIPTLWFLPFSLGIRIALNAAMVAAFGLLIVVRMRSILRTCDACPWQRDWERCPGFRVHGGGAHEEAGKPDGDFRDAGGRPTSVPLEAGADW